MATATNQYQPDYAVPPGWIIEERLAARDISHAELARRCGRSAKLISEIISGKAPIAPKTALQFEKVMGLDASIWLGIEADYRLHRERQAEARTTEESAAWAGSFPVREYRLHSSSSTPGPGICGLGRELPGPGVDEEECNRYSVVRWAGGVGVADLLRRGVHFSLAGQVREGERRLPALAELRERRIGAGDVAPAGGARR